MYDWKARQGAREQDDPFDMLFEIDFDMEYNVVRIGMLLDLDQGSMTIYKNDIKMGVMVAEGLTGPLCWAVSVLEQGSSAHIEHAPTPPSPTTLE